MKSKILMLILGLSLLSYAQENDSILVPIDSIAFDVPSVDSVDVVFSGNDIQNALALKTFYEKLYQLEQTNQGKINIVHIGDSHIQADLFTAKIRR